MKQRIEELEPKEVLALAISIEQANQKALRNFSEMFTGYDEEVSRNFEEMAVEEGRHEEMLQQMFRKKYGGPVPQIDSFEIEGVVEAVDLADSEFLIFDSFKAQQVYQACWDAESRARNFYLKAMKSVKDVEMAKLFHTLAEMEEDHATWLENKLRHHKGKKP